jgi:predicted deacylase
MGEWEKRDIVLRKLPTGHEQTAPVFVCHGRSWHPLAYLQANVHGAELQGNAALLALFEVLENETPRGSLVLVPRVNPIAANQQVGDYVSGVYDFHTGANFNRGYLYLTGPSRSSSSACYVDVDAFAAVNRTSPIGEIKSTFRLALKTALTAVREEGRAWGIDSRVEFALAIQELAIEADVVMDLHTGDRAPRYLYAPQGVRAAIRAFGLPFVIEVPARFGGALDEASFMPWQDLSDAFLRAGRSDVPRLVDGFTVELGPMNSFSLAEGRRDARRLVSALRYYGVLDGDPDEPAEKIVSCDLGDYRSIAAPEAGLLDLAVAPGSPVSRGDLLARIVDPSRCGTPPKASDAVVDVRAPADGIALLFHAFSSIPRGVRLCSMMTNTRLV